MDKETKKLHSELVYNFISDTKVIPDFINGRQFTHKRCWDISQHLYENVEELYKLKILNDIEVKRIYYNVMSCVNDMLDIDPKIGLEYYRFVFDMSQFYRDQASDNEIYEVAENLTKFIELNQIKN
jgi:hypothetical protein